MGKKAYRFEKKTHPFFSREVLQAIGIFVVFTYGMVSMGLDFINLMRGFL